MMCIPVDGVKDVVGGAFTGLCDSQPAGHVATALALHRNDWYVPGTRDHGTMPTMSCTPLAPLTENTICWMCKTTRFKE